MTYGTTSRGMRFPLVRFFVFFTMFLLWTVALPATIYVNHAVPASGDGTSWAQALKTVGEGIAAAAGAGGEIWVAQGTYEESIQPTSNTAIYGGFQGTESSLSEHDPAAHVTTIDAKGAPHVVILDTVSSVTLDGLTIMGGNTPLNGGHQEGGGIRCLSSSGIFISRCIIRNNTAAPFLGGAANGGGVYLYESSATISRCVITQNHSQNGGGIYLRGTKLSTIQDCIITSNTVTKGAAPWGDGGGIYCTAPALIQNCILTQNSPESRGGAAMFAGVYGSLMANCTIFDNTATSGGAVAFVDTDARVANCVFAGNANIAVIRATSINEQTPRLQNCLFFNNPQGDCDYGEGVRTGANLINMSIPGAIGNLEGDPKFVDAAAADFHLQDGSRALDRGLIGVAPALDFEGNPRPGTDGLVDMGAFEAAATFAPPSEDSAMPTSSVGIPEDYVMEEIVYVPYVASDSESGVAFVELRYRRNGGVWAQYGGSFAESPIVFDTALTGGDGFYEFYTVAHDFSGKTQIQSFYPVDSIRVITSFPGSRVYVKAKGSGMQMGFDWQNAAPTVGMALALSDVFDVPEIWVAEGKYSTSITLQNNLSIFGGFQGMETDLKERFPFEHPTFIDASQASAKGTALEHVVLIRNLSSANLDGFFLTGAVALGGTDNRGGGILCQSSRPGISIRNCIISGNLARVGGGIYCSSSLLDVRDSFILGNYEELSGEVECLGSTITLTNCIVDTKAVRTAGANGIGLYRSNALIMNCNLTADKYQYTWGIYAQAGSRFKIANSIIEGCWEGIYSKGEWRPEIAAPERLENCLFFNNGTDIRFTSSTEVSFGAEVSYSGAALINANVPNALGNRDGDPLYATIAGSTWTTGTTYNAATHRLTLTDSAAWYAPHALEGRFIRPDINDPAKLLIVENGPTTIDVIVPTTYFYYYRSPISAGTPYAFVDWHLPQNSPAVDWGAALGAPAFDLDGNKRPIDFPQLGIDGFGAGFDIGAYELQPGATASQSWWLY